MVLTVERREKKDLIYLPDKPGNFSMERTASIHVNIFR